MDLDSVGLERRIFLYVGGLRILVLRPVLAAAFVSLLLPSPATDGRARQLASQPDFRALFEQYRSADPDGAVEEFARWSDERVEREAIPPRGMSDLKSLAALALLHTEAGIKNKRFGLPFRTISLAPEQDWRALEEWRKLPWPPGNVERQKDLLLGPVTIDRRVTNADDIEIHCRTALHLVREIVRRARMQADRALLQFSHSWYIIAASVMSNPVARMPVLRAALVDFGEHPETLLLVGCYGPGLARREMILRQAVTLDPLLVEARLRHGQVLHRLGRTMEARSELERALRDAHDAQQANLEYLADLFLGRLHEDGGRIEAAINYYKAATALSPQWQAAYAALGSAQVAAGYADEGWATGRLALQSAPPPSRVDVDPWYLYVRAQQWQTGSRIQAMGAVVRP